MVTSGKPASCQALAWVQASRSAHCPRGTLRPVASATGMNSPAGTSRRSGLRQRSSASTPTVVPADGERAAERDPDLLRNHGHVLLFLDRGEEDRELVAGEARDRVALAQG